MKQQKNKPLTWVELRNRIFLIFLGTALLFSCLQMVKNLHNSGCDLWDEPSLINFNCSQLERVGYLFTSVFLIICGFLAVLLITIGVVDFQHEKKERKSRKKESDVKGK